MQTHPLRRPSQLTARCLAARQVRLYATAERALLGEAIGGALPELEAKREAAMTAAREEVGARRASCERCRPPHPAHH